MKTFKEIREGILADVDDALAASEFAVQRQYLFDKYFNSTNRRKLKDKRGISIRNKYGESTTIKEIFDKCCSWDGETITIDFNNIKTVPDIEVCIGQDMPKIKIIKGSTVTLRIDYFHPIKEIDLSQIFYKGSSINCLVITYNCDDVQTVISNCKFPGKLERLAFYYCRFKDINALKTIDLSIPVEFSNAAQFSIFEVAMGLSSINYKINQYNDSVTIYK